MVKPSCRRFSQVVGGFKNGVDGFEVSRLLRAGAGAGYKSFVGLKKNLGDIATLLNLNF